MLGTQVSRDVLALVKITVVHVLFHRLAHCCWDTDRLVVALTLNVAEGVSVCHVLSVLNVAASLDHWQLLRVQVLVGIGCKATTVVLFVENLVLASACQIW